MVLGYKCGFYSEIGFRHRLEFNIGTKLDLLMIHHIINDYSSDFLFYLSSQRLCPSFFPFRKPFPCSLIFALASNT